MRTGNLHYATQVSTAPPSFVIFGGARPPNPTYQRYLENRLRRELRLDGVPIRLRFRLARAGVADGAPRGRSGWLSCAGRPSIPGPHGPWRSLVSASDWGSEGRRFESGRPDGWTRARGRPDAGSSRRVLTVPNVISFFRIALIPVFVALIVTRTRPPPG